MKLYHGDSLEVLKGLADNSVDAVVTSPPYDNLRAYAGLPFESFQVVAQELFRIVKPGGVVIWVVGDATVKGSETGTSFKQALYFKEVGFNLHDTMIYKKVGFSFPDTNRYFQNFEYMFCFSKGAPKTFNPIKDRRNVSFGRKITGLDRQQDHTLTKRSRDGQCIPEFGVRYNVWEIANPERKIGHPAIFPRALAGDHILSWTNPGDTVLDPFLGSGTTGVMALKYGRNFIGIEREAEYLEIARKRIEHSEGAA